MLQVIVSQIPNEIKKYRQWVVWKAQPKSNGKTNKIPYNPLTGRKASSTNSDTWSSFEEAVSAYEKGRYNGIGFVLSKDDPFSGVDLDDCINPETGEIAPEALAVISMLNSYSEISPSGTGIRIIAKGKLPPGARKKGGFEVYEKGRFLTITGHLLSDCPETVNERQEALQSFHMKYFSNDNGKGSTNHPANNTVTDTEIIQRARNAKDGALFSQLFDRGDWKGAGYPSQSEADLALCNKLAFWTQCDPVRMEALFRQSALYRDKCDKVHYGNGETYLQHTIGQAISGTKQIYQNRLHRDFAGNDSGKVNQDEALKDARAKVKEIIEILRKKNSPIYFYNDLEAQLAVGLLSVGEQAAFFEQAKEVCPRFNKIDAKRAVKEAVANFKRKETGAISAKGLIQRNGAYYIEKNTNEGPMVIPISNFVIEPQNKLIMPDSKEVLEVDVYIGGTEKPINRLLTANDLLGRKELLRSLGSVSAQWTGTDGNVQQLVGHLSNIDTPTKNGVPFIGHFKNRFVTPDVVLTKTGPEENSNYIYVPQGVAFENYVRFPRCNDWSALAKQVMERLIYLQPPEVIYPLIGWFFACPSAHEIRKRWDEFPILHCWGTGGGGKTSIIQLFLNLLGVMAEPFSTSMKEFAMIKLLSCTNSLPVFLDEYRPRDMDQKRLKSFHEKLLLIYKASKESRGKPDQTTVEYRLWAPVVMAGEAPLPDTETGLQERVIQVKFNKTFLENNPSAENFFNELIELPLEQFAAGYVTWLMNQDIQQVLKDAAKDLNALTQNIRMPIRIKHNLSIMLCGIKLFAKLSFVLGIQLPAIDFNPIVRPLAGEIVSQEPHNAVDRLMLHMEGMVNSGDIIHDRDFILNEDTATPLLYFYTNSILNARAKWCKLRGLEHEVISDKALRNMLSENPSGYVIKPYGFKKRLGDKSVWCTIVDAGILEERLGIPLDTWRSTHQRQMALCREEFAEPWDSH